MKADIINIAGYDMYHTHDSGNMISFSALRPLNMNSIMVLGISRLKEASDTVYIPARNIADTIQDCKVLVLHDDLLKPEEIRKIYEKTKCKIVIIAYTHFHITGGCSYPLVFNNLTVSQCEKFKENCGSCHEKKSNNPQDATYQLMKSKRDNLSDLPITIVVGSTHSKLVTEQSNLFKNLKIEFIPLPNDLFFYDRDKDDLQKASGLDPSIKYMLWGTTQPGTPRKGKLLFDNVLDILWRKLSEEERNKVAIINVGPNPSDRFGLTNKFNVHYAGYVPTRKQLSVAYRTADISVCTTVSDAGPMMITESCMNETPVVAFDRSIAIDLIEDEKTGYLIKDLNLEDMAEKIKKLLFHPNLNQISKNSRLRALDLHDVENVLNKWKTLFESLFI